MMRRAALVCAMAMAFGSAGCVSMRKGGEPEPPPAQVVTREAMQKPRTPSSPKVQPVKTQPARPPVQTAPQPTVRSPTAKPATTPEPVLAFRDMVAAQALLDRKNFSCGCIAGFMNDPTRAAVTAWQHENGLPATGVFDEATLRKLGKMESAFTEHVVTEQEHASLRKVPATWLEKSKVDVLGYETIVECLSEKYHTSEEAMKTLNLEAAWPNPPAGTRLIVPKVSPSPVPQARRIRIKLGQKNMRVYDDKGRLVAWFPCSIAHSVEKRPVGELKVTKCASEPNYAFDPDVFPESEEAQALGKKLLIPPGPNNPVGMAWISLSMEGYGIHGTPKPEDIGLTGSHGCFRLANWNAQKLLKMISIGTPVIVEP